MTVYRKRRLSKIPAPVIIPPPSPTVTAASPVSPDLFSELPSPRAPQSPTKRFVLKPITALTAAFQRTSITGRNKSSSSLLKFPKSSSSSSLSVLSSSSLSNNNNNYYYSPKSPKSATSPKSVISPQSPKPPKSPKLLHRKGSSGSIRKRSESPTSPVIAVAASYHLSSNNSNSNSNSNNFNNSNNPSNNNNNNNSCSLSSTTTNNNNNSKPSFLFGKSPFSLSNITTPQTSTPKLPSKLGIFNLKPPKSTSSCRKALPITPAELSERLHEIALNNDENEMFSHPTYDENKPPSSYNNNYRPKPVLIDVRNLAVYQDEHICESFNVNLPTLLIKRYHRGNMSNFSLDSFITSPESREQYLDRIQEDGGKYYHDIIIFDESMDETDKVSPGWTLLSVLERAMLSYHNNNSSTENINENNNNNNNEVQNRGRVYWLKGGFEAFRLWDQKRKFIITGSEVGSIFSNNNVGNVNGTESDGTTMEFLEGQQQLQPAGGLVRRDSLFSVNTERSSLRRKRSDKNNSEIQGEENNKQQSTQSSSQSSSSQSASSQSSQSSDSPIMKQDEIPRGRRPSNGLQYLFPPSTTNERRMSEPLSLFPNQFVKTNNLPDCLDSPSTPPPITHPEISFVVSTIIPDFLYLGPEISKKEEVEELESKGVKRILNMAFECVDSLGLNEKFDQYLKLNVKDSVEEDVESGLKAAVDFIEQAEKDQVPIYVHCKAGKSRSVTAVLAFLIKSRHWTLRHAYDYVMERRSGICPNIGFVAELMRVEELVLGIKGNTGAITEFDLRGKDEMMDMEGIEPLGKTPRTAFF